MTPVQAAVLPLLPSLTAPYNPGAPETDASSPGRDLLVKAKTGTGKTLAFLVPAIEARLKAIVQAGDRAIEESDVKDKHTRLRAEQLFARRTVGAVIISPTRELAAQIAAEAMRLTHWHKGFEVRIFTGGNSKGQQMREWNRGNRDIVVATPGRLCDLLHNEPAVTEAMKTTRTVRCLIYFSTSLAHFAHSVYPR